MSFCSSKVIVIIIVIIIINIVIVIVIVIVIFIVIVTVIVIAITITIIILIVIIIIIVIVVVIVIMIIVIIIVVIIIITIILIAVINFIACVRACVGVVSMFVRVCVCDSQLFWLKNIASTLCHLTSTMAKAMKAMTKAKIAAAAPTPKAMKAMNRIRKKDIVYDQSIICI